ncbi:MAG TPA: ATPase, T2SS/T4P/T4SS family [Candidatus Marinimicrobia bacterium]|nr:ATPase, T2SS/T4P/T4SS family [Candidatus Neomarinimicrobiota bacterium]
MTNDKQSTVVSGSRLGQILVEKGIISSEILEQALKIQNEGDASSSKRLEDILVSNFKIDHDLVFGTLAELYAFRTYRVNPEKLDPAQIKHTKELLSKFPDELKNQLLYYKVLPYQVINGSRNKLLVLASNPTEKVVEKIPLLTEFKKYEVVYTPLKIVEELIDLISPRENEFLDLLREAVVEPEIGEEKQVTELDEYSLDEEINKSLLVNLYEGCLIEAVRRRASDIHIVPYEKNSVDIYFRIDGRLQLWYRQDNVSPEAMAAVVKDRTIGVDRFERDTAQDGFFQRNVDDYLIRYRVSVLPIISEEYERRFESIVIRIIDDRNVIADLRQLGFLPQAEQDFIKAISKSKGIVILTGPTGSGKSTTLLAALHHVMDASKNILTIEDPVEYAIKGARQLKIGRKLSFEDAIRTILRHDPDIVMVGEIRDKITADVAVKLANTGHLTFTTLHTNDAPSAISRLYKMGVEPFLLAYAINIIVAQRLVRKLCPFCRVPISSEKYPAALELGLTEEDLKSGKIFDAGTGCKKCNGGYKGRISLAEALYFSPEVRKSILNSGAEVDEAEIREIAEGQGMLSILDSGLEKIREGVTTVSEVSYAASEG